MSNDRREKTNGKTCHIACYPFIYMIFLDQNLKLVQKILYLQPKINYGQRYIQGTGFRSSAKALS